MPLSHASNPRYGESGKRGPQALLAVPPQEPPPEEITMLRRQFLSTAALLAAGALLAGPAAAQDTVKIGLILPMTGQQASTGKQIEAAVKLYQQQNGTTAAG